MLYLPAKNYYMKKASIILSGIMLISACSFGQSSGNLVLNKGQKFLVENKMTTNSSQQMMGQDIESKADVFTSNNFEVKDIKDNNYNITNTFTKLTAAMSAMGQNINFDSDKPEDMNGEMGSGVKDFINHPKNIIVDKSGKVFAADSTDTARASGNGMMSIMLKQFFGNTDEAGLNTFRVVPKNAKAGYSWKDSTSKEGVVRVTNYNIKDIKGSEASVNIDGTVDVDAKIEMQGVSVNTKTKGTIKGEEIVDVKTGVVKQRTTTVESTGKSEAMGQEIPTTTKLTTVTTVKSI